MSRSTDLGMGYAPSAPTEMQLRIRKQGYLPATGQPLVLSQHSTGIPFAYEPLVNITATDFNKIYQDIADAGYLIVSADDGGQHFGNDTFITDRMPAKLTWARANGGWSKKPILLGVSQGGLGNWCYARANPSAVAGIVSIVPMCDLQSAWSSWGTALINAAYGGSYVDATSGATHNPATFGAQLAGIPTLILADIDDTTTIPYSTVTALAALIGPSCTLISGHWGGTHGSAAEFTAIRSHMPEILQFMDAAKVAA